MECVVCSGSGKVMVQDTDWPSRWEPQDCHHCAGTGQDVQRLVAEVAQLRLALTATAEMFERVVKEGERPPGGMSVPYHGDFAGLTHVSTVRRTCRWWGARLREALEGKWPTVEIEEGGHE